ncbi:MAG: gamma-glutamylcyclotransferase family protein [Candidatus Bathyarchaeia archaeon]
MAVWYFAYGADLNKDLMRKRVGEWKDCKRATLEGYRLSFGVFSKSWKGGAADIREESGSRVYGAIYLLDEEQLRMLDRYEGVPNVYLRRKVIVKTDDGEVEAVTYVAANPKEFVKQSAEYLAVIQKGLKQHGYGDDVIRKIRRLAEGLGPKA